MKLNSQLGPLPPLHNSVMLFFDSRLDSVAGRADRGEFFGRVLSPFGPVAEFAIRRYLEDLVVLVHDFPFELVA